MNGYVELIVKVPVSDIEIDAKIEKEDDPLCTGDSDREYYVSVNKITIAGCNCEIIDWLDNEIDKIAVERMKKNEP